VNVDHGSPAFTLEHIGRERPGTNIRTLKAHGCNRPQERESRTDAANIEIGAAKMASDSGTAIVEPRRLARPDSGPLNVGQGELQSEVQAARGGGHRERHAYRAASCPVELHRCRCGG
jgi:hypothetical protein